MSAAECSKPWQDHQSFDYEADFDSSCRAGTDDNEPIEVQGPGRGGPAPPFDDTGL